MRRPNPSILQLTLFRLKAKAKQCPISGWLLVILAVLVATTLLFGVVLTATPSGSAMMAQWVQDFRQPPQEKPAKTTTERPSNHVSQKETGRNVSNAASRLRKALAPTTPSMTTWLDRLTSQTVVDSHMTVYLKPWAKATPTMKRLAQMQGIDLRPWRSSTKPENAIQGSPVAADANPQIWVLQTKNGTWQVQGASSDLLHYRIVEGSRLSDLDIVRLMLWSDTLKGQAKWRASHPPPVIPESLQPPPLSVVFLPDVHQHQRTFWRAMLMVVAAVAAMGILVAMIFWDKGRSEGVWEPWVALPGSDRSRVVVWWFTLTTGIWVVLALSWLLAITAAICVGADPPAADMVRAVVVSLATVAVATAMPIPVLTWLPHHEWRWFARTVLTLALLGMEITCTAAAVHAAIWINWTTSTMFWVLLPVSAGFIALAVEVASRRLAKYQRKGWRPAD